MKKRRGKHKRGERGSAEDDSNSAKKLNMDATECASDKDGGEGDEDSEFYETVPEQEPSLNDIKDMLSSVQTTLKDIQIENRKLASEVADLKSSFGFQEQQLNFLKVSLSEVMKANDPMKVELQALRKKRIELKNVKITQLFQHSTKAAAALASERLYINDNLTSFRKELMKEANQMKKDGLLVSVWSMDGKIYVKTSPDGAPKRIRSQEGLDNV